MQMSLIKEKIVSKLETPQFFPQQYKTSEIHIYSLENNGGSKKEKFTMRCKTVT